jgi:hypothetical protein
MAEQPGLGVVNSPALGKAENFISPAADIRARL